MEWLSVLKCRGTGLSISLFSKSVTYTSARFTDVKFTTFYCKKCRIKMMLEEVHVKLCRITKLDLGPEIDVAELHEERTRVTTSTREQEKVPAGASRFWLLALRTTFISNICRVTTWNIHYKTFRKSITCQLTTEAHL